MISLITDDNRAIIENIAEVTPNTIKIKALLKAYGTGYDFVRFYADQSGDIAIALQDNSSTLYLKNAEDAKIAAEFLAMIANNVQAREQLVLDGFTEEIGNTYICKNFTDIRLDSISNRIGDGYDVLCKTFPIAINPTTYEKWYTDLSHRVRHDVSKIYTYDGVCSATAYCKVDDMVMISQLGTLESARGKGIATKLLHHIATDLHPIGAIGLLSQDEVSDKFYERIGFELMEKWYYYERKEH